MPRCGSTDTAEILYGMPHYSEELEKDIKNHKIILGGCCISGFDPQYHCFECDKDFGKLPVFTSKYGDPDKHFIEDYRDIVTSIRFSDGGFLNGLP